MAASYVQNWWHVSFLLSAPPSSSFEFVAFRRMSSFYKVIVVRRVDFCDWPMAMLIVYRLQHPDVAERSCRNFFGVEYVIPTPNCPNNEKRSMD